MLNPINGLPQIAPLLQQQTMGANPIADEYSEAPPSSGPTTSPPGGGMWEFDGSTLVLLSIGLGLAALAAGFTLSHRYARLKVDGDELSGFMPARGFSEVVVDRMTNGLRMFYKFDKLQEAWKKAPESDRDDFDQQINKNGELMAVVTRQPWGAGNWFVRLFSSAYKVVYTYTDDGELIEVVARKFGGIFGDRDYNFIPHRELPLAEPPAGKVAQSLVAEIDNDSVALRIHELARAEGEEIRIFPTVGDFRLAFGKPKKVGDHKIPSYGHNKADVDFRMSCWSVDFHPTATETVALGEATHRTLFFAERLKLNTPEGADVLGENYSAYSIGLLEVVYDMSGDRVASLVPGKDYQAYQVRYLYGRDGQLLKAVITESNFQMGYGSSNWGATRQNLSSRILFTYKPADARRYSDSSAVTDRADVAAAATGERDMSAVVSKISEWLEIAYKRVKSGELMNASGYFLRIANHAKYEGLKVIEAVARVAAGDMSVMRDHPCNFVDAAAAYSAALSVLEGKEFREAAKTVAALKGEAMLVENTQIVRDIWDEMRPEQWLFTDPLAQLEGGVASETSGPTVPPPEIARAGEAVGRAEALRTRREFLDAFRAAERARKSAAEMAKKR